MKTFKEFLYFDTPILSEEIHQDLQSILDRSTGSDDPRKLMDFTKRTRALIKSGEDTGLENSTPKKGSCRAVHFNKTPRKLVLDGTSVDVPEVTKIAYAGLLEKHKDADDPYLGQRQNAAESDNFTQKNYGLFTENEDGSYSTNPEGVLAPVFHYHPDHHYLQMARIQPMTKGDFQRLTKSESHPNGLKFDDMFRALNREYAEAHGQSYWRGGCYR